MKKKKYKELFEPKIQCVLNKEVLKTPLSSKSRPFFINSITRITSAKKNYGRYRNTEETQNLNSITISHRPTRTSKIKTRYNSIMERLNTNILSLKGQYKNILKNNDNIKDQINSLEKRILVGEVKVNEGIMKRKIKLYKNIRENEQNKEKEKNMKMKEEYNKNKILILNKKKENFTIMREKEKNNFQLYLDNLEKARNKKIKIKEEEKQNIKEKLSQQKDRYRKDIELRKKINREKEMKNAERLDGYQVYVLRKTENELRNKVKIELSLNNELSKQYSKKINDFINHD